MSESIRSTRSNKTEFKAAAIARETTSRTSSLVSEWLSLSTCTRNEGVWKTQRLGMLSGTHASQSKLLVLDETLDLLELNRENASCFPHEHLRAARLSAIDLVRNGVVSDERELKGLGFDAYDLVSDARLLQSSIDAFGAIPMRDAFLKTEEDAVALAGTDAVDRLCITTNDLLSVCKGTPTCAYAVLSQIEQHSRFACVTIGTLVGTGLRKKSLTELGYSGASLFL